MLKLPLHLGFKCPQPGDFTGADDVIMLGCSGMQDC